MKRLFKCPFCHKTVRVRKDGMMPRHRHPRPPWGRAGRSPQCRGGGVMAEGMTIKWSVQNLPEVW